MKLATSVTVSVTLFSCLLILDVNMSRSGKRSGLRDVHMPSYARLATIGFDALSDTVKNRSLIEEIPPEHEVEDDIYDDESCEEPRLSDDNEQDDLDLEGAIGGHVDDDIEDQDDLIVKLEKELADKQSILEKQAKARKIQRLRKEIDSVSNKINLTGDGKRSLLSSKVKDSHVVNVVKPKVDAKTANIKLVRQFEDLQRQAEDQLQQIGEICFLTTWKPLQPVQGGPLPGVSRDEPGGHREVKARVECMPVEVNMAIVPHPQAFLAASVLPVTALRVNVLPTNILRTMTL